MFETGTARDTAKKKTIVPKCYKIFSVQGHKSDGADIGTCTCNLHFFQYLNAKGVQFSRDIQFQKFCGWKVH